MKPICRYAALVLAACSVAASSLCYLLYRQDRESLRAVALEITAESSLPAQKVLTLLHWVNKHGATARNDAYFVFRRMRATPLQVLDEGGDCADKSRLLAALLREVGIPSTMAMSFNPQSGRPAHTFLEARIGEQAYMAVDPAFDLYFPKPDPIFHRVKTGALLGYYDLLDLRRDTGILSRRLDRLCAQSQPSCDIPPYYRRPSVEYDNASSINWNKNVFTKLLAGALRSIYGDSVYRFPRPLVLEEPKLFFAALCMIPGGVSLLVLGRAKWAGRQSSIRAPQSTIRSLQSAIAKPRCGLEL